MNLTVDNSNRVLTIEEPLAVIATRRCSAPASLPNSSAAQWVRIGWALQQYLTFSWLGRPILQIA